MLLIILCIEQAVVHLGLHLSLFARNHICIGALGTSGDLLVAISWLV